MKAFSLCRRPNCYERNAVPYQQRSSSQPDALTFVFPWRPSGGGVPEIKSARNESPDLTRFSTLPLELQTRIWELAAEEPRIVAIRSTSLGLRAPISPLLQTCSLSRTIFLKTHTLILGFSDLLSFTPLPKLNPTDTFRLAPRVYFNFSSDILYFPKGWNERVDGQYSCFNHLGRLLCKVDMEKVERIAFDVDASICCPRASVSDKHGIFLGPWKGVKDLYLVMRSQEGIGNVAVEDLGLIESQGLEFTFKELSMNQQEQFLKLYRATPPWAKVPEDLSVEEALEFIRRAGKLYGVDGIYTTYPNLLAEGFCENVCPVLVVGK